MSTYNLGIDHDSDEVVALKSRISVKDNEITMVKDKLFQSSTQIQELNSILKESNYKLRLEADKRTQLEEEVRKHIEERQTQKTARDNIELALRSLEDKLKTSEKVAWDLQATIDMLSSKSEGEKQGSLQAQSNLARENSKLTARVRELDFECRQLKDALSTKPQTFPTSGPLPPDPRMIWLEQENKRLLELSAKHDDGMDTTSEKLAAVQANLMKVENEKVANERRMKSELEDLRRKVEESGEELEYLRQQAEDGSAAEREQQLMDRIDEDQVKLGHLEKMVEESRKTEEALKRAEARLKAEVSKVSKIESKNLELVREKDNALDALARAQQSCSEQERRLGLLYTRERELLEQLNAEVISRESDKNLPTSTSHDEPTSRAMTPTDLHYLATGSIFDGGLMTQDNDSTYLIHSTPLPRTKPAPSQPENDVDAETVQRLLAAIDRIRGERDGLKRQLEFSEMEHKFAVQSYEAKIAAASAVVANPDKEALIGHLEEETQTLRRQVEMYSASMATHQEQVKRFNLALAASSIIIDRLQSNLDHVPAYLNQVIESKDCLLAQAAHRVDMLETQLTQTAIDLGKVTGEHAELLSRINFMENSLRQTGDEAAAGQEHSKRSAEELEQTRSRLDELTGALSQLHVERDLSAARIQSLETDLASAQQRLADLHTRQTLFEGADKERTELLALVGVSESALHLANDEISAEKEKRRQVEDAWENTQSQLNEIVNGRAQLVFRVASLEHDLQTAEARRSADAQRQRQDTENLEEMQSQLADIAKALAQAETQRDSSSLQVQHLESDLSSAQAELADVQSRYSTLQAQKLSSMSSTAATRALRQQIEELEARVMRRTEQIGVHQHDIRRMEANLRLQEERISEMTFELETLGSQKEAMVEDCAEAREARDIALRQVEAVEMDMEAVEERAAVLEREKEKEVSTLVYVIAETTTRARDTSFRMKRALYSQLETQRSLLARLHQAEELKGLAADRAGFIESQASTALNEMNTSLLSVTQEARQAFLALAVSQQACGSYARNLEAARSSGTSLEKQLSEEQDAIQLATARISSLEQQLETTHEKLLSIEEASQKEAGSRIADLEVQIQTLNHAAAETEGQHRAEIDELAQTVEMLKQQNEQGAQRVEIEESLRKEIQSLNAAHAEEIQSLQDRLHSTTSEIAQIRSERGAGDNQHEELRRELEKLKQDLRTKIDEAEEHLEAKLLLQEEIGQSQVLNLEKLGSLQQDLERATMQLEKQSQTRAELESQHEAAVRDLIKIKVDLQTRLERCEATCVDLQQKLDDEVEGRDQDRETYKDELRCAVDHSHQTETELHRELLALQQDLDHSISALEAVKEEKNRMEAEMTNYEAEIQRSVSLRQYLEKQVKEDESEIASLKDQLANMRSDYAHVEKNWSATEVRLSLQESKHKEAVSSLKQELEALRTKSGSDEELADLKERYDEMEELLKAKCAEVEATDDKYLEVLQERRKLNTRLDTLNRKVQTLEKKLAETTSAPKATTKPSGALPTPPISSITSSRPNSSSMASRPSSSSMAEASSSQSRPRSTIGTSRTKTPEPRPVIAKAPRPSVAEKPREIAAHEAPEESAETAVSIGKKRRAPDDFDVCEAVPPQVFTPESLPSKRPETMTPRSRRNATALRTGFTPVRKPPPQMDSSRRVTTAAVGTPPLTITDVTNSNASGQRSVSGSTLPPNGQTTTTTAGKRSWLRNVRAGATQPSAR